MENFDIEAVDVKSMRLILGIARSGSVTDAAFDEGLSQSTASYRLDRLRDALNDQIFIRGPSGMELTIAGVRIIRSFSKVLEELEALGKSAAFDPTTATMDFVVAATAFEIETVLAPFLNEIMNSAPGCRLIVRPMETRKLAEALRDDFDIALLSEPPKSGALKQKLLLRDELVTYFDPKVRTAPLTLDEFCAAEHAVASLGGSARSGVDLELRKLNRKRRIKLETSNIESLAPMMKGTPLITTIPSKLGPGLMRDFHSVACPLNFPTIPFHLVWHARKDGDAAHGWLRRTLSEVARSERASSTSSQHVK
ncbi:LysR family transcriptional regulator [Marivita hallyeonensis]|uniref:DNA-binding transcriptional regulator, LysR family n=1 Tax=Marivita hallyeonensis TaxID=996342 RepID=A0A1M5N3K7_9RHOB|nr:LysR family transcriptional regulator [Marivita hallyeonensis]SHG84121.1 DNA-binding transcriptional regulator, LysR family [Marivita hallyeonensis]